MHTSFGRQNVKATLKCHLVSVERREREGGREGEREREGRAGRQDNRMEQISEA